MAKKEKKTDYKKNILMSTTIFAIIGTIVYTLIVYLLYSNYITVLNIVIFFVVVWIVYYFIARSAYNKYS